MAIQHQDANDQAGNRAEKNPDQRKSMEGIDHDRCCEGSGADSRLQGRDDLVSMTVSPSVPHRLAVHIIEAVTQRKHPQNR